MFVTGAYVILGSCVYISQCAYIYIYNIQEGGREGERERDLYPQIHTYVL